MTDPDALLARLADRLRDPSAEGRAGLLVTLADLFAQTMTRASAARRDAFGDLIAMLARPAPDAARAALAARLAGIDAAPDRLMGDLARDGAGEVAAPVLHGWPGFSEDALADFAQGLPVDLLHHLAANVLIRRADLPQPLILDLPWLLPVPAGRRAVARALDLDPDAAEAALHDGFAHGRLAADVRAPEATPGDEAAADETVADFIAAKQARGELREALAVRLLRDRDMPRFLACLAALTGLAPALAARAVRDPGGHAFAVMALATGLSRSCFATLTGLLAPDRGTAATFALMEAFEMMDAGKALRLTALWQLRFAGPDAPPLPFAEAEAPRAASGRAASGRR